MPQMPTIAPKSSDTIIRSAVRSTSTSSAEGVVGQTDGTAAANYNNKTAGRRMSSDASPPPSAYERVQVNSAGESMYEPLQLSSSGHQIVTRIAKSNTPGTEPLEENAYVFDCAPCCVASFRHSSASFMGVTSWCRCFVSLVDNASASLQYQFGPPCRFLFLKLFELHLDFCRTKHALPSVHTHTHVIRSSTVHSRPIQR